MNQSGIRGNAFCDASLHVRELTMRVGRNKSGKLLSYYKAQLEVLSLVM